MKTYEITFVHPNDNWTWIFKKAKDFHEAMLLALLELPDGCRVKSVVYVEPQFVTESYQHEQSE